MSYFHEYLRSAKITSGYLGSNPYGGKYCSLLETQWKAKFKTGYAVAVNSATSGLLAACMAIGIKPGDEVIVSPYTMSATAAAPAVLGAKIVFCDIERETLCMAPEEALQLITDKTKAIIVTNLFGCPAELHEFRKICDDKNIFLIEDNAQAILAKEDGQYTGTIGHIGVFSLNVHKHIQTGEGGVVVTDDADLDKKLRGAMNHGEMRGLAAGLNLRMTEITASIALDELREVDAAVAKSRSYAVEISNRLTGKDVAFFESKRYEHSYYCIPFVTENRDFFISLGAKPYVEPLYHLPAFSKFERDCPIAEWAYKNVLVIELCHNPKIEQIIDRLDSYGTV